MAGDARPGLDTKKKTLNASEQDPVERAAWRWQAAALLHAPDLVFVDESGANRALCPRYGYAPRGQRCFGQAPRNRGTNTSILAAMGPQGLLATMTVEGATNKEVFSTYLDHFLCPALRQGQTVVMDNLAVHKNEEVRAKIEARGCRLWFLPAYSPDFNPIEHAFAKLKNFLRKAKARTQDSLQSAIGAGLDAISAKDACGWFKHCGFPLPTHPF